MNKVKRIFKKLRLLFLAIVIASAGLMSFTMTDSYFEVAKNLDIFASLFREINVYYVDNTDPGKLMKDGIDAMLESLDPYTNYIPESDIEDYRFMTTGQYGGIGAMVKQKGDYVIIADPYEGYPAQKSGLMSGDEILEIDGVSAKGKKTDDISKLLKGQPRTEVKVLIQREGEPRPFEKVLVREEIKIKSVPYSGMINAETGYIKLTGFMENASNELKSALLELKKNIGLKSVVLDLRGNPGGLLNEAINIASLFVAKGQHIVSTKGKVKEWDKTYPATGNPVDTEIPIAVLVNSGSASAAEIVSGTLQDLDRGVIIGQRTFGKGLVQTTRPLSYNAQLKVTTAKYYIPSGRCIQAIDYSNKNEDGSVGKIPDSLMSPFKTKNGRTVYDGGGVLPDIVLEPEKLSNIAQSLINKGLIFDYATRYRMQHPTISSATAFKVTDETFNEFVAFISGKEYDYTTKSEQTLDQLKETAEKEKYFDAVKSEYEALKLKLMHDKKADVQKNKAEIAQLLTEEIVSRYYYQKGRLESSFSADTELLRAIETLKFPAKYASILAPPPADVNKK